ncbi:hypothetical protein P154DRAFT_587848 [Amniculicola lignicola CBS 123094]|uniref:Uncharacterized protein n=1 Tax=Amniculicola lignicola CBS 123094 TaxID=1392246 RepID=A0A6A5WQV6_9PLEO|nr:hypothetical protein P154DRAFT_587848 [Amniculicola lignicola CBS 123094]
MVSLRLRHAVGVVFVSLLACEVSARSLKVTSVARSFAIPVGNLTKRYDGDDVVLVPISDPSVLTGGKVVTRDVPGDAAFDPLDKANFFWGAYGKAISSSTLQPLTNELILPLAKFASKLASITCGFTASPVMSLKFGDKASFAYAKSAWDWVNNKKINTFTLITEPNQCYHGGDRTPYLIRNIQFDDKSLTANLNAEEKEWSDIAHTFDLHLGHEHVNPDTANTTHPHLVRRESQALNVAGSWSKDLFTYTAASSQTAGLAFSAGADLSTGGNIISDFSVSYSWFVPTDAKITIYPQGLYAQLVLRLNAKGKLGKPLDWLMSIGPAVTLGLHLGTSALEGSASLSVGAKATIGDSARVNVQLRNPANNGISGWTPKFTKIDPQFSAEISGSVRTWVALDLVAQANVLNKWGYQAGVEAQLPYFEAKLTGMVNTQGVCPAKKKTIGIDFDTRVGIDVNLQAGEVNKAPAYKKDLLQTYWPLFSTCVAFGPDVPTTSTRPPIPPAVSTKKPFIPSFPPFVSGAPAPTTISPNATLSLTSSPSITAAPGTDATIAPISASVPCPENSTTTIYTSSTSDYSYPGRTANSSSVPTTDAPSTITVTVTSISTSHVTDFITEVSVSTITVTEYPTYNLTTATDYPEYSTTSSDVSESSTTSCTKTPSVVTTYVR